MLTPKNGSYFDLLRRAQLTSKMSYALYEEWNVWPWTLIRSGDHFNKKLKQSSTQFLLRSFQILNRKWSTSWSLSMTLTSANWTLDFRECPWIWAQALQGQQNVNKVDLAPQGMFLAQRHRIPASFPAIQREHSS